MSQWAIMLEAARLSLSGALIGVGLVFMAGGAIGMARFPDFYTRLHAAGVSDAVGGVILIAGLALASGDPHIAWKLGLLAALIAVSSPTIAHMAANAAHVGGLADCWRADSAAPATKARREAMNAVVTTAEQWGALALSFGVIAAALGAVTARSLFAMAMYLTGACAMASAALLALTKPDAALALALFGVGIAPFMLLSALLLSQRVIKPRRARPWLMLTAGASVGGAMLWTLTDLGAVPLRIAMGPDAAPHLAVGALIAPLLVVGSITCLALLGFGERGAFERLERDR